MDSKIESGKPHAVCIPFPAQGHINPMLKLAKLLNHKGFHITFVNTEYNHRRLLKSRGPNSLDGLPTFRFEAIPDGLPPSDADATQDVPSLCYSTSTTCSSPLRDLIRGLNDSGSSNLPPVTCIVTDGVMSFALEAAEEFGIPGVLFWTTSACGFYGYIHYATLVQMGYIPLQDAGQLTNGHLDTVVNGIPGMAGIRLRDLPSFLRTTSKDDIMLNFVLNETARARRASAILLNTFEDLEHDVLNSLSSILPAPVYAIGPLQLVEKQCNDTVAAPLDMLGSNLWKEEPECLEWLDSKEENSVVYVNFGSAALMTSNQLMEFAWGLANSKQAFLWIIRPDIVSGGEASLPPEFLHEVKGRGFLSGWCAQEKVVNHPSVGGFLAHNGWNSNLESICSGVAMICWPFFAEQQTNCWYSCTKWGIGMEIDNNVKRDEVKSLVLELMTGEKGKELKTRAAEWKKLALESAKSSSYENLDKVINQVLLSR